MPEQVENMIDNTSAYVYCDFSFQNPYKGTGDDRAAKRTKKNDDKVDVNERWEENNPGFELTAESEPGSPSSPEDWHSRVPSVSFFSFVSMTT